MILEERPQTFEALLFLVAVRAVETVAKATETAMVWWPGRTSSSPPGLNETTEINTDEIYQSPISHSEFRITYIIRHLILIGMWVTEGVEVGAKRKSNRWVDIDKPPLDVCAGARWLCMDGFDSILLDSSVGLAGMFSISYVDINGFVVVCSICCRESDG